jgi:uroporphyrinogen decarboxylase
MRQAGRYLPAYRKMRQEHSLMDMFQTPDLIEQATHLPIDEFGLDAAILFSDILMVYLPLGYHLEYSPGPIVREWGVKKSLRFVEEGITKLKKSLSVPLIGFCGGPLTVSSYLYEDKHKGDIPATKEMLYRDPVAAHAFLEEITQVTIEYVQMQEAAGVDAIQIFDSWAGLLDRDRFCEFSMQYVARIAEAVSVPVIFFSRASSLFAKEIASSGVDAISFDWGRPLKELRDAVPHLAVQGNIDPRILQGDDAVVRREVTKLLRSMEGDPGFILNLGHGVLPDTRVEGVRAMVSAAHHFAIGGREQRMASVLPPDSNPNLVPLS